MCYLFFYIERFLWILWNLCEIFSLLTMIIFSRKDRRERKVLFTFRISRWRWSGRKLRYDKSAQRVLSTPSVASLLVHPVSGGQFAGAVLAVVTAPSHRGEGWGGVHTHKTFTSLSARCWAGKSSYRQGSVLA